MNTRTPLIKNENRRAGTLDRKRMSRILCANFFQQSEKVWYFLIPGNENYITKNLREIWEKLEKIAKEIWKHSPLLFSYLKQLRLFSTRFDSLYQFIHFWNIAFVITRLDNPFLLMIYKFEFKKKCMSTERQVFYRTAWKKPRAVDTLGEHHPVAAIMPECRCLNQLGLLTNQGGFANYVIFHQTSNPQQSGTFLGLFGGEWNWNVTLDITLTRCSLPQSNGTI